MENTATIWKSHSYQVRQVPDSNFWKQAWWNHGIGVGVLVATVRLGQQLWVLHVVVSGNLFVVGAAFRLQHSRDQCWQACEMWVTLSDEFLLRLFLENACMPQNIEENGRECNGATLPLHVTTVLSSIKYWRLAFAAFECPCVSQVIPFVQTLCTKLDKYIY